MNKETTGKDISKVALSLQAIIDRSEPTTSILPLTHATGAIKFFEILSTGCIKANYCKYYKEQLLYLFYGRPAYRPDIDVLYTSDEGFRPISILLHPSIVAPIARVVPIDTGAFSKGLFSSHCPSAIRKENFEISYGIDAASRHVNAFFGNNKNYYLSRMRKDLKFDPTQLVAMAYVSIQSNTGQTITDDRRSTIEIQFSADIEVSDKTVMAVALPEAFLENEDLCHLITNTWNADPIPYDIYHDSPLHDVREILARVKDYLTYKGLM